MTNITQSTIKRIILFWSALIAVLLEILHLATIITTEGLRPGIYCAAGFKVGPSS